MALSSTLVQSDVEISNALQSITALVPDAVAMAEPTIRCFHGLRTRSLAILTLAAHVACDSGAVVRPTPRDAN
jgi:hypothetical protein